jgi:phage-related protein
MGYQQVVSFFQELYHILSDTFASLMSVFSSFFFEIDNTLNDLGVQISDQTTMILNTISSSFSSLTDTLSGFFDFDDPFCGIFYAC